MKLTFEVKYTLEYKNVSTTPEVVKILWSFLSNRVRDNEESSGRFCTKCGYNQQQGGRAPHDIVF